MHHRDKNTDQSTSSNHSKPRPSHVPSADQKLSLIERKRQIEIMKRKAELVNLIFNKYIEQKT
jgi:hypothetical protein